MPIRDTTRFPESLTMHAFGVLDWIFVFTLSNTSRLSETSDDVYTLVFLFVINRWDNFAWRIKIGKISKIVAAKKFDIATVILYSRPFFDLVSRFDVKIYSVTLNCSIVFVTRYFLISPHLHLTWHREITKPDWQNFPLF